MKKTMVSVFAAACVMGLAAPRLAVGVTVPWGNGFETNTEATSIVTGGDSEFGTWFGTADVIATVTNIGAYAMQTPKVTYPLNSESHTKVLAFKDGTITNVVTAAEFAPAWVDVMLQPVRMEMPTMTPAISNSQMSLFVDTNGFINVYHGVLTSDVGSDPVTPTWTALTDFGPIGTDKWVRVTVKMDYSDPFGVGKSVFQIQANGYLFTNSAAYEGLDPVVSNGTWFICANSGSPKISQVAFSGSGMIDDLVISDTAVSIAPGLPTINASAVGNGTISPSGNVEFPVTPATTNFVMTANAYYHISSILTNGAAVSGLTGSEASYDLTWENITSDGSIVVTFSPNLVGAHNTPQWWLAQYTGGGVSINNADTDTDGDGAKEWEEYVAGTIPVNASSVLKVLSQQLLGTTNQVKWLGSSTALAPAYAVQESTNLVSWTTIGTVLKITGTNVYNGATPATSPRYYRVAITNY